MCLQQNLNVRPTEHTEHNPPNEDPMNTPTPVGRGEFALALSTIYASIALVLFVALETPSAMWPIYLFTIGLVLATVWCSVVALRELRRARRSAA